MSALAQEESTAILVNGRISYRAAGPRSSRGLALQGLVAFLFLASIPGGACSEEMPTFPYPTPPRGLTLVQAHVRADIPSDNSGPYCVHYDIQLRREAGPERRILQMGLENGNGFKDGARVAIAFDGDSVAPQHVILGDSLMRRGYPHTEAWRWPVEISAHSAHHLMISLWASASSFACGNGFDSRFGVDFSGIPEWDSLAPPLELVVHFDPILGREAISPWLEGALFENGNLTWELDRHHLLEGPIVVDWWSEGAGKAILTKRHVIRASEPRFEHYAFVLGEDCMEDEVADSMDAASRGQLPDSLTPSMRRWVLAERAEVEEMVRELESLRSALVSRSTPRRTPSQARPDSSWDGVLNPVARNNLVLGHRLLRALDVSLPPSRIWRETQAAFEAAEVRH